MSAFDRVSVHSVCAAILSPLYHQNTNAAAAVTTPTTSRSSSSRNGSFLPITVVALCVIVFLVVFDSVIQPVAAFGESPVSSLDPADIAPLSDSEVDSRVEAMMRWVDSNVLRLPKKDADPQYGAVASKNNKDKQPQQQRAGQNAPRQWLPDERADDDDDDNDDAVAKKQKKKATTATTDDSEFADEGSDFVFPLEMRRGSRVSSKSATAAADPLQQTLRVFARRNVQAGHVAFRLPAKLILSYTTLCPYTSHQKGTASTAELEDGLPEFCRLISSLRQHAIESEECSVDKAHFQSGFQTAVLSLFLVYQRWGAASSSSSSFYKPYVDLVPRVPPTPVCTFTDSDLELFELAGLVRSERERAAGQWHFFFDHIASDNSNFTSVFPRDSLTLPRFLWAHCNVKARMLACFNTHEPCLVPVVDAAAHASFLGANYASRLTMAKTSNEQPQQKQEGQDESKKKKKRRRVRRTKTGELVESDSSEETKQQQQQPQLALDMKFETHLTAGRELLFDHDHRESSFLHRGALDSAYETVKFRCNAVLLPRNISSSDSSSSRNNNNNEPVEGEVEAESEDGDVPQTKQQQQQQPHSAADPSFEALYNPCIDRFLAVPSSTAHPSLAAAAGSGGSSSSAQQYHQPYMCLREHELFHTLSVVEHNTLYDPTCEPERLRRMRPRPSTTETRLRAVAFVGKLVRFQLERLSEQLNEIEKVIGSVRRTAGGAAASSSSSSAGGGSNRERGDLVGDEGGAFGESEAFAFSGAGKRRKKKKNNKKKSKTQDTTAATTTTSTIRTDKGSSNSNNRDDDDGQVPSYVAASLGETSLCASWGFANNGGVVDAVLDDSAAGYFSSTSARSIIASSPGKPCRIFEGAGGGDGAKHALIIHDWTTQEHEALLGIYEQLVKLRAALRKQLEVEGP